MYAVQAIFNSKRLDPKLSEIYIFTDINDVVDYVKHLRNSIEVDVSTNQTSHLRKEIALHWAKKGGSSEEQTQALIDFVENNDYSLPFTFLRIAQFCDKGRIGKMKNAVLINDNIYYVKDQEKDIFTDIVSKVC